METIVLGGGCFWCLDAAYRLVDGVKEVVCGYSGGHDPDPTYETVSRGTTGHAEVVKVVFDPEEVSLDFILGLFWKLHDPTSLNRQGADEGPQYRSAIYYSGADQKAIIEAAIAEQSNRYDDPIVTEVALLDVFHEAEAYHQDYFNKNPSVGYCQFVVAPKVRKAKEFIKQQR